MVSGVHRIELHGFSDASCSAYGAYVFLRSIQEDGSVSVRLLYSNSRIASLHQLAIPRLERCGAVLIERLINTVIPILKTKIHDVKLWAVSQIVLTWIMKTPGQFQVYARNRVVEINKLVGAYE